MFKNSQVVLVVKNPPANAGDLRDSGLIPGLGRSLGGGHGNPLTGLKASCAPPGADGPQAAVQELATNFTRDRRPQGNSRAL